MKNIFYIVVLVIICVGVFYLKQDTPLKQAEVKKTIESIKDGKYCFDRLQKATEKEPYEVKEIVVLNIKNGSVVGVKNGTQNGPDMTNGYTGDLSGSIKGVDLELVYSYVVEGSKGKELEIYKFMNDSLVKFFWVLVDKGGVLTPDKIGDPKMIFYQKGECKN